MLLVRRHREVADLACDDCRRYLIHEGRPLADATGRLVEDPGERDCGRCAKGQRHWPSDSRLAEIGRLLTWYRQCREFHCLPRAGGLGEQDGITMRAFDVFRQIEADDEEEEIHRLHRLHR